MKASDEEEYGSFYANPNRTTSSGAARYRYREYSPSRTTHHQSTSASSSTLVDPAAYSIPQNRAYTRTPPYGAGGRGLVEYAAPPCCHQFYHAPPPPVSLHPSPSHFNTIPHPPLQYRDVPACATLNRSCYNRRSSANNPYTAYYSSNESPYGDPRSDIYYTSTLTRHPRNSAAAAHAHRFPPESRNDGTKLYEPPPPPAGYGSSSHSGHGGGGGNAHAHHMLGHGGPPSSASSMRSYVGIPPSQGSLLRLDEPRIYSSSALQLGTNPGGGGGGGGQIQRSNSPQHAHHFIDRSISLIRLDNSGSGSNPLSAPVESNNSSGGPTRIKFTSDLQNPSQAPSSQNGASSTLIKTTIELGSSSDPLQINPTKSKFKIVDNPPKPQPPMVETSDKGVMTTQFPEQWPGLSCGGVEGRRISMGAGSPPGGTSSPAPTLSGGVPDLLPSCVLRHMDTASNNPWRSSGNNLLPSPRRNFHGGCGGSSSGSGGAGSSSGAHGGHGHSHGGPSGSGRASGKNVGGGSHFQGGGGGPSGGGGGGGGVSGNGGNGGGGNHPRKISKWAIVRKYIRSETKTFFGLVESGEDLKEEWLSRRKRFASRRYSERNVDSMPPPSPYQPTTQHGQGHDHPDARIPTLDPRPPITTSTGRGRSRRTRKKDHVFVVAFRLFQWLFWALRFGRTGQRVAAGAGCGSDTPPGSGSSTPGRVPLSSQMSRDRTKSRSITPLTLADVPPNVTVSAQEVFFDDMEENHRNSSHHLQPPGRGLHWRIARPYPSAGGLPVSNRISSQILIKVLDNSERRQFRQGLRQPTSTTSKLAVIDEYEDFRPYFTYWVSIVQTIILIVSMITYGLAPAGFDLQRKSSLVLVTSLSLQQMEIIQPPNFWIGPSAGDLIHLGAKYAPCMRRDEKIYRRIIETRDQERQTACCIRNDNSGCVQSSRNECSIKGVSRSGLLSTWKKWTGKEVPGGRISGSVCGLDPKFCEAPASIAPYEWPDDITKWPICRKTRGLSGMSTKDKTAEHMVCEVIGHPCCIGIHARCVITTREYCRFVSGYFHEEAMLCSQVSCLQDVCGMFPFLAYESPDQFYRLISSLFLHAGLVHISVTLLFHWFILRDLEKLAGPLRISIIYLGAGIAGNLGSVLLEPHRAEVGPGGGQFGLLACLLIELLHMWGMLRRPWQALGKMVLMTGALFLLGFLPWVDNFAHMVGFAAGFLLSHALMPYIAFGKYSAYRKWLEVVICLVGSLAILVTLLIVFYAGFGDCEICRLLNCLPLTQDFCAEQEIDLKPSGGGINLIT